MNSKKPQFLNLIYLSSVDLFSPVFTFWLCKNDGRSSFSPQKICMVPSLELSIIWSLYIALKLLWRIWGNGVKEGPLLHTFLQIIYKTFKTLVLSYNISHFVRTSKRLKKNCPDIRSLLFLCNEELRKSFDSILIVCRRWHHSE